MIIETTVSRHYATAPGSAKAGRPYVDITRVERSSFAQIIFSNGSEVIRHNLATRADVFEMYAVLDLVIKQWDTDSGIR